MLDLLGIRSDLALAGIFGATFLVFYRHLTPRQSIGAFAGGVGSAVYFSAITARALNTYFTWFPSDAQSERLVAFVWGLVGSFFLAGLIVLGERWKKDPTKTIQEIKP